ncbi:MAG: NAD(P)/FAD-dependent oxidoreductase [Candidatus Omnitrophica bacterium]|nr:NAD(P)/FAD-dependent oxidoreductase [Candidatus Omnitrophota bacterium]
MRKTEVAIIGGGMAGLSAAAALCENSKLNVTLIEKDNVGVNETVRAVFTEIIEEFGLGKSILSNYSRYVFHSALGEQAYFDYKKNVMVAIDYKKACNELLERALSKGLILIKQKAVNFSSVSPESLLLINLKDGDSVITELLIDASGYTQWAAHYLHIPVSRYYSVSYGELLKKCQIEDVKAFRLLAPNSSYGNGGGWAYPLDVATISFGYSIITEKLETYEAGLKKGYFEAKSKFEPYAAWINNAEKIREEAGIIPVGRIGRFVDERVLIIGDAAGQANPWSIEGCRPALLNGRLAAQITMKAFDKKKFNSSFLMQFEREWNQYNRERFWRTNSSSAITWFKTSDMQWDKIVASQKHLDPEVQFEYLKENKVPFLVTAYAIAGFIRRALVKKLKWMLTSMLYK